MSKLSDTIKEMLAVPKAVDAIDNRLTSVEKMIIQLIDENYALRKLNDDLEKRISLIAGTVAIILESAKKADSDIMKLPALNKSDNLKN